MAKKTDGIDEGEVKLEDILRSIRGIIDNNNEVFSSEIKKGNKPLLEDEADNVLELTSVLDENTEGNLVSENTKHFAKAEINKLNEALESGEYRERSQSLDIIVNDLMRPLIKDWLDNNLPKIVENIVSDEIKKIIPKK